MHYASVTLLLFASKAFAAPLQKRQVQVEIVDVTVTAYATVTVPYESSTSTKSSSSATTTHHKSHRTSSLSSSSSSTDDGSVVFVTYTYVNGVPVEATPTSSEPAVVTITSTPEPVYVSPTLAPVYSTPVVVTVAPAPSYTTAPSTSDPTAQAIVDKHNVYRANHNVDPLTWDDSLAAYAAANMPECVMQHTPNGEHGENLSFGYADPSIAVRDWYNEGANYNFNNPGFNETTGHFTQVVWKGTSSIGCHINTACNYMKCEYSAPGNFLGEFQDNVFKPNTNMYTT